MRNLEEFNQIHRGECAFVLGSGPSLAFQNLEPLQKHVTIAVNSSYVAMPNATYFLSDDHDVANWSFFAENLRNNISTTVLLYENKLSHVVNWFGGRSVVFRHRTGYNLTDEYEHDNYKNHICQARTSLGSAIHVAHIMGCDPIVILGLDCCRTSDGVRWFWQLLPKTMHPKRLDKYPIDRYKKIRRKNVISDMDLADILDYWNIRSDEMKKKCRIINASPVSTIDCFDRMSLDDVFRMYNIT
jgi:hypothetical protein